MKQYLKLLSDIKENGTEKPAARENMPGTISLFGYQFRHNLQEGFPLLTTKQIYWKGVVAELIWFLRGDTNIKYLVNNGVNIWNEDSYQYYLKICKRQEVINILNYKDWLGVVKGEIESTNIETPFDYVFGDVGNQYGTLWRDWEKVGEQVFYIDTAVLNENFDPKKWIEEYANKIGLAPIVSRWNIPEVKRISKKIDQIADVITSLKTNPMSRRHIVTAWNPSTLEDMALNACHAMFQFNCRPISTSERYRLIRDLDFDLYQNSIGNESPNSETAKKVCDEMNIPEYYLDCQLYQRSADVFLGVPFNIASYALLIEIIAKICNMIPGDFVHTFGDVHIYDNHMDAVDEQLSRTPIELPKLKIISEILNSDFNIEDFMNLKIEDFELVGYTPQSKIKGELSTGLKK